MTNPLVLDVLREYLGVLRNDLHRYYDDPNNARSSDDWVRQKIDRCEAAIAAATDSTGWYVVDPDGFTVSPRFETSDGAANVARAFDRIRPDLGPHRFARTECAPRPAATTAAAGPHSPDAGA